MLIQSRAIMRQFATFLVVTSVLFVLGCGGRTTPATQPTPAAFDPATSDAKSLAAVDAMQAALGGLETWDKVKQLRFDLKYYLDGVLKSWTKNAWDMWNQRIRFDMADMSTYNEKEPDKTQFYTAMYDIFHHDGATGSAMYGNHVLGRDEQKKVIKTAWEHFDAQVYMVVLPYKAKDPGVKLAYDGERSPAVVANDMNVCDPMCDVIKVSFVPEVGSDTYWIHINRGSKMPEVIEKRNDRGRLAYALGDWTEVKGLKFPQKFQNVGMTSEMFKLDNIKIGDPEDELYIPQVRSAN